MPIETQPIDDENIIIIKISDPFKMAETIPELSDILQTKLDSTDGTLYYISDICDATINFADLVSGMGLVFKGGLESFSDSRLHMIVVSESSLVKMGSKAAQQTQYGGVNIKVFATVDDALTYARGNPQ